MKITAERTPGCSLQEASYGRPVAVARVQSVHHPHSSTSLQLAVRRAVLPRDEVEEFLRHRLAAARPLLRLHGELGLFARRHLGDASKTHHRTKRL